MAKRKRTEHDIKTREKIKTAYLVNRLTQVAMGEIDITKESLKAIEILLKKTLPDLTQANIEMYGELEVRGIEVEFVNRTRPDS